jgi:3',5'-cyclic AMP phosphodiesterase CpdA
VTTTILHLSDTHFGTEQPPAVQALQRFVRAQAPALAILSGDLTQRATAAQFAAARAFVDGLGIATVLAIPGNHDIPLFDLAQRLGAPYARYAAAFGTDREPVHRGDGVLVACVDTTRPWRHKNGEVSAAQVARTEALLRAAPVEVLRLVVTHQPVAVLTRADRANLLRGREHAVRRWAAAGADLVLAGHIHLPFVCPLREHVAGLAREVHAVNAGTAVSRRVRDGAGNSVNLILAAPNGPGMRPACVVERWDFDAAAQAFVCAQRHRPRLE